MSRSRFVRAFVSRLCQGRISVPKSRCTRTRLSFMIFLRPVDRQRGLASGHVLRPKARADAYAGRGQPVGLLTFSRELSVRVVNGWQKLRAVVMDQAPQSSARLAEFRE